MATRFSWSDGIQAVFAPCLACLQRGRGPQLAASDDESQPQHEHGRIPRARADELEGLLADSDDAETLSLHSNLGDGERRRKRRRRHSKGIRIFGYDLFGKPPIHLTDDDDDEPAPAAGRQSRPQRASRPRANDDQSRTIPTDTLDSDAAPLDSATIDELSAARVAESMKRDEHERNMREERRKLRRERKELKKAALQLAIAQAEAKGGAGFEGFQGSGPAFGHIPSPFRNHSADGSDLSSPQPYDEFGPFEQGQPFPGPVTVARHESDEADMDGADFGAENYARRVPGGSSTGAGSDSRSGTSASMSNTSPSRYTRHHASHQPSHPLPQQELYMDTPTPKKKKSRKSGRLSVSSTSQSTGPISPPPQVQTFSTQPMIATPENAHEYQQRGVTPDAVETFVDQTASTNFPSTGLRGGMRRKNSEAGVFLARRGDA